MWTVQLHKTFQFTSANASCCSFTVLHMHCWLTRATLQKLIQILQNQDLSHEMGQGLGTRVAFLAVMYEVLFLLECSLQDSERESQCLSLMLR